MLPLKLSLARLGKEFNSLATAIGDNKSTAVFYATQNSRYHIASELGRFFLYVTPDRLTAHAARDILADYCDGEVVLVPEKDDVLINLQVNVSESLAARLSALTKIYEGKARGAVISAEGLTQYFPGVRAFASSLIRFKVGEDIDPDELTKKLVLGGYRAADVVTASGEFSRRGEIIDVWSADAELPVRVDLFGDTIESLRFFAPETMLSVREIGEVTISPKSDIMLSQNCVNGTLKRLLDVKRKAHQRLAEIITNNILKLEANPSDPSLVWLTPYIRDELSSIFDYLPANALVVLDEPKAIDDKVKLALNAHSVRVKSFAEAGEATSEHLNSLIGKNEVYEAIKTFTILGFQQITSGNPLFEPQAVFSLKSLPISKYSTNYGALAEDLRSLLVGGTQVLIYAGSVDTAHTLADFLQENEIASKITSDAEDKYPVLVLPERISRGILYPSAHIMLIGTDDIIRRTEAKRKSQARKRQSFVMPEKGDYVVHEKHGIGLSEGLVTLVTGQGTKDYYAILYRGGDRLYLPVDKMDEVDKYTGGGKPALSKLGGKDFDRIKERVRTSVKAMAIDLVKLYEKRLTVKGYKYQPDTVWQKELEDAFPYQETDDQLIATAEIKEDMESGKVMDRLLCGDVGFGKTEVAVRAIFKTIIEGKQAAFLSPTTILCQQHFNTLLERLKPFNIKIDILSRFVSQNDIKGALKRIKSGETSVVVATHRLLSKDVEFHDLGLLVLDEEQRFGVEHKEKIKVLKNNVNVLSLSATPIPRTLHMAMSGIRDISTLETPPRNRLPVETYVVECSDTLIQDACRRELARGGQVFILYNRVVGIERYYEYVHSLLGSEVDVIYAHGQMEPSMLEERIRQFYNKEASVLVATTIIENGIDLPDANTLIVIDSDRLGLAELYQLRGRVGRSHNLAYAYFTVREGKVLTSDAEKRLDAIMHYTELGSGFKIAMQDLEIRGAGNILGKEQHGNMEKVGYDLYCRILRECVDEMQGKPVEKHREVEINVSGDLALPKDYIEESSGRVRFYKRVASLSGYVEQEEFVKELKDVYGAVPLCVMHLVYVGLIKNLAQRLGVKKIVANDEGVAIFFYDNAMFRKEGVFRAIDENSANCVLMPTEPPSILFNNKQKSVSDRLQLLRNFLITATSCGE